MLLSLVFHNHQPVGQLPWAFEDAWRDSYHPFLEVLERHPKVKVALHYTGPLLEWLEANRPATLDQVRRLTERGQVELLGGGLYEPILAIWPEADQLAQLQGLTTRVEQLFGIKPRGLWLAERVWEPQLAGTIGNAGLEFTFVDSSVFEQAGIHEAKLTGCFETPPIPACNTGPITVFPINYTLRQLIPWKEPEQVIDALRHMATAGPSNALAVFADDGEKFGGWPGTFEWIFERGWLDRFFSVLEENQEWLLTITPSEYLATHPAISAVELPPGSYAEMQEWSQGNWRNFLARYSESADMHREVLRSREAVVTAPAQDSGNKRQADAYDHILRAQSNDAYWHGVFGGLYLSHLRQAVYSESATARALVDGSRPSITTPEAGGRIELNDARQALLFEPAGGALAMWSSKIARHNLLATLRRRREPYHAIEGPTDWYPRAALLDHFFGEAVTPESFATATYAEQGDFVTEPWTLETASLTEQTTITAARNGGVWHDGSFLPLTIVKRISVAADNDRLHVEYTFTSGAGEAIDLWWGNEWNVVLSGSQLPERHYHANDRREKLDLTVPAQFDAVTQPIVADRWLQLWIEWEFPEPVAMWHVPLFTTSQKEGGEIEETYQQSAFLFHRCIKLQPQVPLTVAFDVELTAKAR